MRPCHSPAENTKKNMNENFPWENSLVIAGMSIGVMAARDARYYPAGDEILGHPVHRPAYPKDYLDAVLLEQLDGSWPHPARDHVGHPVGSQERRQDTGLVARTLQYLPVEYDTVLD